MVNSTQYHIDRANTVLIPQKVATTVCFIREESSGDSCRSSQMEQTVVATFWGISKLYIYIYNRFPSNMFILKLLLLSRIFGKKIITCIGSSCWACLSSEFSSAISLPLPRPLPLPCPLPVVVEPRLGCVAWPLEVPDPLDLPTRPRLNVPNPLLTPWRCLVWGGWNNSSEDSDS